eukprot:Gb_36346 [translate_table: standard]
MGSAGNPGFDIQNFFKTGSPGNLAPSAPIQPPFHPVSHPFTPGKFAPETPYPIPASGSFAFSSQAPMFQHPYMNYSQEQISRPYPSPPPYSQQGPSTVPPHSPSAQLRLSSPIPSPHSDGAKLMALLNTHSSPSSLELPPPALSSSEPFHASMAPPAFVPPIPTAPPVNLAPQPSPARLLSTKLPRGRHLHRDHVVYDIDLRLPGEAQPQLEVSPITVYTSDPLLVRGRQIAVNRNYICYGLRTGAIRILNINTALRALLRGHSQRVTDMAFFANDVHLLASASSDGRVFIRKIEEGFGDDEKMQITEHIVLAIQIMGDWESVHPHVCWHPHQQDVLFVGVGSYVLKIDVSKTRSVARGGGFSAEDPFKCNIESLVEGVSCIGKHDGDVTDLSVCHWNMTHLASSSKDGMVKIWGDKKMLPLATLKPHDGQSVSSVGFLTMPHSPDQMVLFTAGPLNQELKLWVYASLDGRLSPSSSGKWQCIQTLELKSTSEPRNEYAFFNQVLVVPRASVILLANAKKNAIYTVHLECSSKPADTRMDYMAEFSVTMPILSLTATSENVSDGQGTVQIYCVQTQAIQQYALDMSQCFPPPVQLVTSEETVSHVFERSTLSAFTPVEPSHGNNLSEAIVNSRAKSPRPCDSAEKVSTCRSPVFVASVESSNAHDQAVVSCVDPKFGLSAPSNVPIDNAPLSSQVPVPLSPRLSRRLSGSKSPLRNNKQGLSPITSTGDQEHSVERKPDSVMMALTDSASLETITTTCKGDESLKVDDEKEGQGHLSGAVSPSISVECQVSSSPSYLITPSQLMSMVVPSENATSASESSAHNKCEETGINTEKENMKHGTKDAGKSSSLVEDAGSHKEAESGSLCLDKMEKKEKIASSQSFEASGKQSKERISFDKGSVAIEYSQPGGDSEVFEDREQSLSVGIEEYQETNKDTSGKGSESASTPATSQSPSVAKRRKNKNKNVSALLPSSSPSVTPFTSMGSSDGEPSSTTSIPSTENLAAQVLTMQETLRQLITMQKELQKQMTVTVTVPVVKEGKRMEAALGQRMEKLLKAQIDAMWARIQEENAKRERAERQLTALLSNSLNKELPATLERLLKKEITTLGPAVARLVTPSVEKTISIAINEAFQKGVSDKALPMLEKSIGSKLESLVSRQIQTQFQSSGKQVLQDALRSCFEASVIPAFDQSCRAMFEQVDSAFQKGMAEHTAASQQQFSTSHTALAATLQDTVASASSLAQSLKGELADGQRKLLALAESAGPGSARMAAFTTKPSNGGLGGLPEKAISLEHLEASLDPTKELSRLVSEHKYEEAFNKALQMSDVSIVLWLCSQVDYKSLFSMVPFPLSQGVLLSLVQQLGFDLEKDTADKLVWIREASSVLNPNDLMLARHMRGILTHLYQNLHRQMLTNNSGAEANSIRLVLHVVNSLLTQCK